MKTKIKLFVVALLLFLVTNVSIFAEANVVNQYKAKIVSLTEPAIVPSVFGDVFITDQVSNTVQLVNVATGKKIFLDSAILCFIGKVNEVITVIEFDNGQRAYVISSDMLSQ